MSDQKITAVLETRLVDALARIRGPLESYNDAQADVMEEQGGEDGDDEVDADTYAARDDAGVEVAGWAEELVEVLDQISASESNVLTFTYGESAISIDIRAVAGVLKVTVGSAGKGPVDVTVEEGDVHVEIRGGSAAGVWVETDQVLGGDDE